MSLFGFYATSAAWMFALLAPLILFYFLKLKRPRLEIPSLVLWRQVLADQRVNSPFQKFKRNILLLLQILLLSLIVLAAMQPFLQMGPTRMRRLPVIIDASASMAALDKPGGQTRLDLAKEQVGKMIDGLLPDQELCIISFADTAQRRCDFTNNKRILREALDGIKPVEVQGDVEDALRMSQALAQTEPFEEALLYSDGCFPSQTQFELSFKLNYQKLDPAGANVGITAFNASRSGADSWDVFVGLEASSPGEQAARVRLTRGEDVIGEETVVISKEHAERLLFQLPASQAQSLKATLAPSDFDSLSADNEGYLALPALRPLWVYCPPSLGFWRQALRALPDVRLFPAEGETEANEAAYDLVVTDREEDLALNASTVLTVGLMPVELRSMVNAGDGGSHVVDWQRNAMFLQHVELSDLVIMDEIRIAANIREGDIENAGFTVLAHGNKGPLILERRGDDRYSLHILFHTDRSTLPYRVGFPVMAENAFQIALGNGGLSEVRALRTGTLPPVKCAAGQEVQISGPGGTKIARADSNGIVRGAATEVGNYVVKEGSRAVAEMGVNLLDSRETTLDAADEILFQEDLKVQKAEAVARSDRAIWRWLALFGFVLLAFEWWYFQRRPGGYVR